MSRLTTPTTAEGGVLLQRNTGRIARTMLVASLLGAVVAGAASPARAQHVPGVPATDWNRARADYTASVLRDYTGVINQWRETLDAGDGRSAAAHYAVGAILMVPGTPAIQGRDSIQAYLDRTAPAILEIRTGLTDFVASDHLAYATGPLMLTYREGATGPVHTVTGQHVTVLVREGRRWRIRSQVLRYEEPEYGRPAS
jgi:ketosteroid isomerase-like protein